MTSIEIFIDVALASILLISAIWLFSIVSGYGGKIGKAFRFIGWGSLTMALSHIVELVTFYLPIHDEYLFIFTHRFLATVGFLIVAYGFKVLIKK